MRIQSQTLNKLVGVVGAGVLLGIRKTLTIRRWNPIPQLDAYDPRHSGTYIWAAWHESILAFAYYGLPAIRQTQVLISQHQDGEYISQVMKQLGAQPIRGSTRRGARTGLRRMMRADENRHLAITPDGPRGPRRHLQSGAIFLASHTGLPIVPLGFGFTGAWRAKSWDRFAIPLPFSSIMAVAGWPISVPPNLDGEGIEFWRRRVESAFHECTDAAEAWASGRAITPLVRRQAA